MIPQLNCGVLGNKYLKFYEQSQIVFENSYIKLAAENMLLLEKIKRI